MTCLTFFPGHSDFWPRAWASLPDSWDVCILFLILTWVFSRLYQTFGQKKHFLLFSHQHWYLLVLKFWLSTMKALLNIWCTSRGRFSLLSLHFSNIEEMLTNILQLHVHYLLSPSLMLRLYFHGLNKASDRHCRLAASSHSWGEQRPCWLCSAAKGRAERRLACNCLWSSVCICWIIDREIFSSHLEDKIPWSSHIL